MRIPVNPFTLKFHPVLEGDFNEFYRARSRLQVTLAMGFAMLVLAAFGFLDRALSPEGFRRLWQVRYFYTMPFLLVGFVLSLVPALRRFSQVITCRRPKALIIVSGITMFWARRAWGD